MHIEPVYATIGELFRSKPMFFVPKYQRAYAWTSNSISDFIKDLMKCVEKRKAGDDTNHFLGGILSIKKSVAGVINQHEYEIIDGQQRIATISLLASCLIKTYKTLKEEAGNSGALAEEELLQELIKDLSERFVEFKQVKNNIIQTDEVLKLSKADNPYFRQLIRDMPCTPTRDSHERILKAYSDLSEAIRTIIQGLATLGDRIDALEVVKNVLVGDFTVIHMVVNNKKDAYTLFQVINDRGTSLTDGDLLRAKTLEVLEQFPHEQDAVEELWDLILTDAPSDTNNYLNWVYESYVGNRTPQNELFDMFLDKFFPQHQFPNLTAIDAQNIHSTLKTIYQDILNCRRLIQGQWLYDNRNPVTGWDRTRLSLLLAELDHTLSIPLFLAASLLDHRKFSDIVQAVEKTFFRYKLICNQHATALKSIYLQESVAIRNSPATYDTSQFKNKLQALLNTKASDATFKNGLEALLYQESGGNKPLKYFLMTVEYYYQWYKNGAVGNPECLDKSRVYDFAGTSIEHVYPKKAQPPVYNATLEPLRQNIGNLTIMDPKQNSTGGNDDFATKKPLYIASSVELTQEIGAKAVWTLPEISGHQNLLIDVALKVFRI